MNAHELPKSIVGLASSPQNGRVTVDEPSRAMLQDAWCAVSGELARLAAAMGVGADEVDDLLHEVFVVAWERGPVCTDAQQWKWWLIRVMVNRCRLVHRRRSRWRRMWQTVARLRSRAAPADGLRRATEQEERQAVGRALDDLPAVQRAVLVLRYFEDYDSRQIGQILDMPHATVRSHLHRARKRLGQSLTEAGYEPEE